MTTGRRTILCLTLLVLASPVLASDPCDSPPQPKDGRTFIWCVDFEDCWVTIVGETHATIVAEAQLAFLALKSRDCGKLTARIQETPEARWFVTYIRPREPNALFLNHDVGLLLKDGTELWPEEWLCPDSVRECELITIPAYLVPERAKMTPSGKSFWTAIAFPRAVQREDAPPSEWETSDVVSLIVRE